MTLNFAVLALLDGIAYASLLFLVAVGLTLIFGVLGILNIAHGSLYTIDAYSSSNSNKKRRRLPALRRFAAPSSRSIVPVPPRLSLSSRLIV